MAKTIKLYVGCGLTNAPEEFKAGVERLKSDLRKEYEVFDFLGTVAGTAEDVYRWDIEHCVATCDFFLAVCDYPSMGLGWELHEAVSLGKPVLAVAHNDALVTRLILGAAELKPNMTFVRYASMSDVPGLVATETAKLS